MITPEPRALPDEVVTFTSTTAGRTFAMTASRTVSMLFAVSGGTVTGGVVPVCNGALMGATVAELFLPICQPANRPILRTTSSAATARTALSGKRPRVGEGCVGGVEKGYGDCCCGPSCT